MVEHRRRTYWLSLVMVLAAAVALWSSGHASSGTSIRGQVLLAGGQPAAGAWVRVQTSDNLVYADKDGSFELDGLPEGVGVVVTAWYAEYKVGWAAAEPPADVTIVLEPYSTTDNADYAWNTSYPEPGAELGCGHCMQPAFTEWKATAHAGSATSSRFLSLYNGTDVSGAVSVAPGYKQDFPGTTGNCATCHAPGPAVDAPFTTDMSTLAGVDREGVFCEFCHKVGAVYLDPSSGRPYDNAPGTVSMRIYRPEDGDQIFFGSLDDVNRRVSYLPLEQESEFCAPCHQFSYWGTPIYQSFREWQESSYADLGVQCQSCHMPAGESATFALPEKGGLARNPQRMASHLDLGIKDTAFMTSSVAMTVTTQPAVDSIRVSVAVGNVAAGHHIPTDYPGRHMILSVTMEDSEGRALDLLEGQVIPDWGGDQSGKPGKVFVKLLRDVATGDAPVVNYWKQSMIVSDTRIPALGSDTSTYLFESPPAGTVASILVELRYRRNFAGLMAAKGWQEPDIVMAVERMRITVPDQTRVYAPLILR
ncbi:MAG: multiheme c-type cytochrome [Caldilineaceae bacterium]